MTIESAGLRFEERRVALMDAGSEAAVEIQPEHRLRQALRAAQIGTWEYDARRGELFWDEQCRALLGVSPDVAPSPELFFSRVHAEDRPRLETLLDRARALGAEGRFDIEYRLALSGPGASPSERWLRATGRFSREADGRECLLGTLQEISPRQYAEHELQREKQRAEEANRAKDEFLAMLGHELRNPLSPILTALQLMRLRGTDHLLRERTIIERQVLHMVRLVDDLLDVSRVTQGKVELKKRALEVADVVAKAIEMASPLLEQKGHRLVTSMPTTSLLVEADEDRLAQVLSNLLSNAAKYTSPGGTIEVRVQATPSGLELRVKDDGIGMDAELLPRVFEQFVQGKRTLDRSEGGLGLGLAIARSLVELHGGTITAHSRGKGQGSEFVVQLPRPSSPADGLASPKLDWTSHATEGEAKAILVVDDNRDAAEVLAEALEAAGYVTRVAFDGPSALEVAHEFRPDLALLDIGLPVMDGYELAKRLRDLAPDQQLKLVAITGYGQKSDRERSHAAGFDEHLVKPIDLGRIESVIHRLIGAPPPGVALN